MYKRQVPAVRPPEISLTLTSPTELPVVEPRTADPVVLAAVPILRTPATAAGPAEPTALFEVALAGARLSSPRPSADTTISDIFFFILAFRIRCLFILSLIRIIVTF